MLVGLLADTHDRLPVIAELTRRFAEHGVDVILHAGDYCSPFALEVLMQAQLPLIGVFGRNDGDRQELQAVAAAGMAAELYESPHSFDMAGRRIMLLHELSDTAERSLETHAVVIHGATHRASMVTRGEAVIVNPGEACGWMFGTPTAALLDLVTRQVEFITLNDVR